MIVCVLMIQQHEGRTLLEGGHCLLQHLRSHGPGHGEGDRVPLLKRPLRAVGELAGHHQLLGVASNHADVASVDGHAASPPLHRCNLVQ